MICRRWYEISSLRAGLGEVQLCEVADSGELAAVASSLSAPPLILGGGTNILGLDTLSPRAAVRLARRSSVECRSDGMLRFGAGQGLCGALRLAAANGWGGLAALSGIPGTVGGAVAMNAGANGMALGDVIESVEGWDCVRAQPWRWQRTAATAGDFAYRCSPLPPQVMVFFCTLRMQAVESAAELAAIAEETQRRRLRNPQAPSAGSVFRNPPGESAGRLLEAAGCKGMRRGNLSVSAMHANWIVNVSGRPAAAADALSLIGEMRRRVRERFAVTLKPEYRIVGEMLRECADG